MAKKEIQLPPQKPVISLPGTKTISYFPKKRLLYGILLLAVGVADYLQIGPTIPKIVLHILLVLSGIWFLLLSVDSASSNRRRALMKKYI
ncbi:MAG TPA: hypothetical protein VJI15_02310 [Candidatus Nanoarchaeia archaeon]|nr:hypothetical protein [Candidatus Nanoarchaeia archaeon]